MGVSCHLKNFRFILTTKGKRKMNNLTKTENNAPTYLSSLSPVLDLFAGIGAMRNWAAEQILESFSEAYDRDPERALKVLFWGRAARIGAGERKTVHTILDRINAACPTFIANNASVLADLGYYKDLALYMDNPGVVKYWATKIRAKDRLACKWAPRKGSAAKALTKELGMTNKEYRKHLKANSATVEQLMSSKDFGSIEYPSVPGRAMRGYRKAFDRNDKERFQAFLDGKGTAAVSASYPTDVISLVQHGSDTDHKLAEKQWENLEDFILEGENIMSIVDVSYSMDVEVPGTNIRCWDVSAALGLYISERTKGSFKDTVITFESNPQMVNLKETGIVARYREMMEVNWGGSTNFEAAYNLLLDSAQGFNVPQEQMPTMLLCISDMQFDRASDTRMTHLDDIKARYKEAGYTMPKLVFWNVNARPNQQPARHDDPGVALVSGFSPAIMKAILSCEDFNPLEVMREAIAPIELNFDEIPDAKDLRS